MSKFSSFNVTTHTYKVVNGHSILVDVSIPKQLAPGSHPLIVRLHGGYLLTGAREFEDWFPTWVVKYALMHSAIIVAPDYRLLPESTGLNILHDIDDFYNWIRIDLPNIVSTNTRNESEVDLQRVIVQGDSAGGYLAIQFGLRHPNTPAALESGVNLRALIVAYPMLDLMQSFFTTPHTGPPETLPGGAYLSPSLIDTLLPSANTDLTAIVSHSVPPARLDLSLAVVQHGRFVELLVRGASTEAQKELFPEEVVKAGSKLPPLFIYHGTDDAAVPVGGTQRFVALLRERDPAALVHLETPPGDHGFDVDASIEEAWLKQGLEFVTPVLQK